MAGDSKLANQQDVERRLKRAGHLIRDRHAATWQSEHEDARLMGISGQLVREQSACFAAITESFWVHLCLPAAAANREMTCTGGLRFSFHEGWPRITGHRQMPVRRLIKESSHGGLTILTA